MPDVERLLEELTNAYGPSGFEGPVRAILRRELEPLTDHVEVDGIGSIITRLNGPAGSPRVMMAAHMDEVGAMVKFVTPEGYVKFQPVGGWLDQGLIGHRFVILTRKGEIKGITALKTPHVMSAEERTRLFKREDMFLDIGATSKADAEERLGVTPGDPIAPDSKYERLNGEDFLLGKAWDDRIGCAVIIEVMRAMKTEPPPNTLYGVGTVQEEVGLRGAHTSSFHVNPDIGLCIESGVAGDYPGITPNEAQERLGEGPGIFLHDTSMMPNLKLRDLVVDVAKENSIPLQFEVLAGYGEDGAEMQKAHSGAPTINISVPVRYLHNHNGVIHRKDFDKAVALVIAVVRRLDAATVAELKAFD